MEVVTEKKKKEGLGGKADRRSDSDRTSRWGLENICSRKEERGKTIGM